MGLGDVHQDAMGPEDGDSCAHTGRSCRQVLVRHPGRGQHWGYLSAARGQYTSSWEQHCEGLFQECE